MPNWCESDLTVKGPKAELDRLSATRFTASKDREGRTTTLLNFDLVIPYPERFKEMDRLAEEAEKRDPPVRLNDGFNSGGYEWCSTNWGTKWSACACPAGNGFKMTAKQLFCSFQTAWAAPFPVILELSRQFPALTFSLKWYEMGMAVQGTFVAEKGEVVTRTTTPYRGSRGG